MSAFNFSEYFKYRAKGKSKKCFEFNKSIACSQNKNIELWTNRLFTRY